MKVLDLGFPSSTPKQHLHCTRKKKWLDHETKTKRRKGLKQALVLGALLSCSLREVVVLPLTPFAPYLGFWFNNLLCGHAHVPRLDEVRGISPTRTQRIKDSQVRLRIELPAINSVIVEHFFQHMWILLSRLRENRSIHVPIQDLIGIEWTTFTISLPKPEDSATADESAERAHSLVYGKQNPNADLHAKAPVSHSFSGKDQAKLEGEGFREQRSQSASKEAPWRKFKGDGEKDREV